MYEINLGCKVRIIGACHAVYKMRFPQSIAYCTRSFFGGSRTSPARSNLFIEEFVRSFISFLLLHSSAFVPFGGEVRMSFISFV